MRVDAFPAMLEHCLWPFSSSSSSPWYKWISLPQAEQTLTALRPSRESNKPPYDDESTGISSRWRFCIEIGAGIFDVSTPSFSLSLSLSISLCWHVWLFFSCFKRSVDERAEKASAALCSERVISPRSKPPRALLHLIVSSAHSRWEGPTCRDRAPRQWYTCSAATGVAGLFFPPCRGARSPRGIRHRGEARATWRRGRGIRVFSKINDKWPFFPREAQEEKNSRFYARSSYWPISPSIIQSRLGRSRYKNVRHCRHPTRVIIKRDRHRFSFSPSTGPDAVSGLSQSVNGENRCRTE